MKIDIGKAIIHNRFVEKIRELSGQNLLACYQCGKCSAGCPAAGQMDALPHLVIRFAQLGMTQELLQSKSIWICASCMTCNTRCPKGIGIAEVLEAIRQILLRKHHEHFNIEELAPRDREELPPIALISSLRKSTS